jgi:hypothetical protein
MSSNETGGPFATGTSRVNELMSDFHIESIRTDRLDGDATAEGSHNELGALALFGPEGTEEPAAESRISGQTVSLDQIQRDAATRSPDDSVRALRARLASESQRGRFRFAWRLPAAPKFQVPGALLQVRSFLVSRFQAFLIQHPKLPVTVGLTLGVLVAGVIAGHFVGRITSLASYAVPPASTASSQPAGEVQTPATPAVARATPAVAQKTAVARKNTGIARPGNQIARAGVAQPKKSNPQVARINVDRAREVPARSLTQDPPAATRPSQFALAAPRVPAGVPSKPEVVAASPVVAPLQATSVAAYQNSDSIYSARDADVRPPQMLEADLPRPAVASWPTITNTVELLVNESGSVDRVKWLTNRERMPDIMLLSRAKMWKFSPATRDGQPVRYRLVLSWEVNP